MFTLALALLQAAPAAAAQPQMPVLDQYYKCLVDEAIRMEKSAEAADIVARAVVHSCSPLFPQAAATLRTQQTAAARRAGLNPDDASGFDARFKAYSIDYALTRVINLRAWNKD